MGSLIMSWYCALLAVSLFPVAPRADDDYNPLTIGLRWEASVEWVGPDGTIARGRLVREIVGTERISGQVYFKSVTRHVGLRGLTDFTMYRRKAADGIYAIDAADPQKREYLETALPLTIGRKWTMARYGTRITHTVEAMETLSVAGRKFERCLKVTSRWEGTPAKGYFYLAPGVGNVLEVIDLGESRLKYTLESIQRGP
jgi:hypothetical protein